MLYDEQMRNIHKFDWSNGATIDQAKEMISYLVDKLQQAMTNPLLHDAEVQGQLQVLNSSQLERGPERPLGEGSKGGAPSRLEEEEEEEVPCQEGHAHHNDSPTKNGGNDTSSSLDSWNNVIVLALPILSS